MLLVLYIDEEDYWLQQDIIRFTRDITMGCVTFDLIEDNLVESTESLLVRIVSTNGTLIGTNAMADIITVSIEDSDSKSDNILRSVSMATNCFPVLDLMVGFTQRVYTALESVPIFDLCTLLEEGQVAAGVGPINVGFRAVQDTASRELLL